jgi:large subunit ribosomal protein L3
MQAILGKKIDQYQRFLENGRRVPVTKVQVTPNTVLALKTVDTDGYSAVQIGTGLRKHTTKSMIGHVKKANMTHVPSFIKEIRVDGKDMPELGSALKIEEIFEVGDIVQVTGTSKGKGFAGVMKRHNFRGGPRTHGQSDRERAPGSIGQTTTPGRVYRGKRMAGHMGVEQVTIKNITVVSVDADTQTLLIDGLVPGSKNTMLIIKKTGTDKKYVPLQKTADEQKIADAIAEEARILEEKVAAEAAKEAEKAAAEAAKQAEAEAQATPVSTEEAIVTEETPAVAEEAPAQPEEKKEEVTEDGK